MNKTTVDLPIPHSAEERARQSERKPVFNFLVGREEELSDKIESLTADVAARDALIAEMRGALEPFAVEADRIENIGTYGDDQVCFTPTTLARAGKLTLGAFRRARTALEKKA